MSFFLFFEPLGLPLLGFLLSYFLPSEIDYYYIPPPEEYYPSPSFLLFLLPLGLPLPLAN